MGLRWPRHRERAKSGAQMLSPVPDFKAWFPDIEGFEKMAGKIKTAQPWFL